MSWVKPRLMGGYGVSTHGSASVWHQIDPDRVRVKVVVDRPELTEYRIHWYCGRAPKKILTFVTPPRWYRPCHSCQQAKTDPLYWDKIDKYSRAARNKKKQR